MSAITTSEALSRFIQNKTFEVEIGSVRPATLTKAEEFVAMLGENLPDTEVEDLDPQDFRRLIQTASKRWGPLRLKQLRSFVLGWLRWCLEDEGLIERMPRTGSLKTPKVVAKPKETYTPAEIRTLFNELDPFGRSLLGLGLFAGLNCSDIEHLTPAALDGVHPVRHPVHLPTDTRVLAARSGDRHHRRLRTRRGESGARPMLKINGKTITGLGDVVEAVAEATGAKKIVEKIAEKTGRDCGCAKRKDWLNRAVPFGSEDPSRRISAVEKIEDSETEDPPSGTPDLPG